MDVIEELTEQYFREHLLEKGMEDEWFIKTRKGHARGIVCGGLDLLCKLHGKHYSGDDFLDSGFGFLEGSPQEGFKITTYGKKTFKRLQTEGLVQEKDGTYSLKLEN